MSEEEFSDILRDAIDLYASEEELKIDTETFEDAGVLTSNVGIIVKFGGRKGAKFQITIV